MENSTYIDKPNTMGVSPAFREAIMNAHYLLGEFITHMERLESAKVKAVEYKGKKLGELSEQIIPSLLEKAESDYMNIRIKCGDLPTKITFYKSELVSNCCSWAVRNGTDICAKCGEYCELIPTE